MKSNNEIIQKNLGLVHACANKFKSRGIDYEDLFQSGCIGLIKAVNGFDESLGFKFSTYAVPVILGEIKRLFREGGSVKVSRSLKELSIKVKNENDKFIAANEREPSINELSKIIGIEPCEIVQALNASLSPISLTISDSDEENGSELDIPSPPIEEQLTEILSLKQSINKLEAKDRSLVFLRFFKNYTQSQTAKSLGMTQVQVSRREKKILSCLKIYLNY